MTTPSYAVDLFDDDGITMPYAHYRAIRELGPVVYLPAQDVYAVGRYKDVKSLLLDHRGYVSGEGVSLNAAMNMATRGTTLASDAPLHPKLRGIVGAPLLPRALEELREQIQMAADELIVRLARLGSFDGVADLARFLPVSIVSNLVGLREEGRGNMLDWAAAVFDGIGPENQRTHDAMPAVGEMVAYTREQAGKDQVKPGSWAARIYAAADEGLVAHDQVPILLLDYLGPSLDTTIFATGHLLDLLGRHPDQWQRLREDPSLIPNAIDEAVRLESPLRGFCRVAAEDGTIDGAPIAKGSRVLLLYASANRDERKWARPEEFDIQRADGREHLGFGLGRHVCAGQHLAKLEMECLLRAMVKHFSTIQVGTPLLQLNNMLRGFASLPVTVTSVV